MDNLLDAYSLASACWIFGLDIWEQKKVNHKFLLKSFLRQFNFEEVEGSEDGTAYCYLKLHHVLS